MGRAGKTREALSRWKPKFDPDQARARQLMLIGGQASDASAQASLALDVRRYARDYLSGIFQGSDIVEHGSEVCRIHVLFMADPRLIQIPGQKTAPGMTVQEAMLRLAQLLGRQIAQETFVRRDPGVSNAHGATKSDGQEKP
jgi:hypothetical protein